MNKRFLLVALLVLSVGLIIFLLATLFPSGFSKPISTPTPTEIPYSKDDYFLSMQAEFVSDADYKYFDVLGSFSEESGEQQVSQEDAVIENGAAIFGEFPIRGANFKSRVNYNTALHIRWKINAENTCYQFSLSPMISQENALRDVNGFGVGGCSYQTLQTSYEDKDSNGQPSPFQGQGNIVVEDEKWIDAVFWVEKTSSDPVMYLFAWETENPMIYYAEKRFLNGMDGANMFFFSFDVYDGSIAVDSFQMISGDMKSYLWFNAPAFSKFPENIIGLFNTDLIALIPEVENESEQSEVINDDQEGAQMVEEQQIEPTWNGILTWPDPEPIIPYLAVREDLAYCPTCEHTVYGVNMTPVGYVFSASYGYPPENTPANVKPCVEEWVQLFDRPVTKAELFYIYRLQNARIKTNGSNEPFQVLYNGSETNLMFLKSNVLINSSADNTRNNYSTGLELIDLTASQIPEDGLVLPDLVNTPSTVLNEDLANEVLEAAWLAYSESPATPVFDLNDRVNFYFQLKKPVEKIESAVYHPDSQTYLSYYWMDNPSEGEMLPIAGCLAKGQAQNANGYYFRDEQNTFLIRIWADGELISEFEVEG